MNKYGVSIRGWASLASAAIALMAGTGTAIATFGVFLPWLTKEFGWTRGQVSMGLSICMILQTLCSPAAGFLVAKFGARKAIVAGNLAIVLAFIGMGFQQSLWHFYAAYALIGIGFGICGIIAGSTIAANWFGKNATLGMSILSASSGVGAFFLVPITSFLIGDIGWRNVDFAIAAFILVFGVLLPFVVVKDRPKDMRTSHGSVDTAEKRISHQGREVAGSNALDLTLKQAIRTSEFWLITAFFATQMFVYSFFLSHQVAYLIGAGISSEMAAITLGVVAVASVAGNLAVGTLSLRYGVKVLSAVAAGIVFFSTIIAFFMHAFHTALLFSLLFGFGHGAAVVCILSLYAVYFGKAHFPEIFGVSSLLRIAGAVGAPVGGFIFDARGTYFVALIVVLLVAVVSLVLLAAMRQPVSSGSTQARAEAFTYH